MTVPAAPTELGGAKILFLLYDNSGANAAALLRGVGLKNLNGETTAHLGIATHEDNTPFDTADDHLVVQGGVDRSGTPTARAVIVDPNGRVISRPLAAYDAGAATAFAHPLLIKGAAIHGEMAGHIGVASHIGGATYAATDPTTVISGATTGHVVTPVLTDAAGRVIIDRDFVLAGTGTAKIATTGTAVKLKAASVPCRKVMIKAYYDNAATIFVGISTVTTARAATTGGFELRPGDAPLTLECSDLTNVYINGTNTNGTLDGVSFMWWT